jgi:hypothetical protein
MSGLEGWNRQILVIESFSREMRRRMIMGKRGFPSKGAGRRSRRKPHFGFIIVGFVGGLPLKSADKGALGPNCREVEMEFLT